MNFDLIAPAYQWLEWVAFGQALQRHRLALLKAAEDKRYALVMGDGDGRFLAQLLKANSEIRVDCIDASSQMLALSSKRLVMTQRQHVNLIHADALQHLYPDNSYDLICTHFFLDCFSDAEVSWIAGRVAKASKPKALWIISEFRICGRGWRKVYTTLWVRTMYLFFRFAARLGTRNLPNHHLALTAAGFHLKGERTTRFGLIASELWILQK